MEFGGGERDEEEVEQQLDTDGRKLVRCEKKINGNKVDSVR